MNKIAIINNFGMFPTSPPNSTSKVCNLLKKSNMNVTHIDLNLMVWKTLLSKEYLKKCEMQENRLLNSNFPLCEKISSDTFYIIKMNVLENIDRAMAIFKDKEQFADAETLSWATNIVFQAQQVIYYNFGTFIHNKMIIWPVIGSNTNDLEMVYKLSKNKEHNPLIEIFEEKIMNTLISLEPDIIGIDILFPWEIVQAVTLNKLIKKHLPKTHINFIGYGFDEFCFSRVANNMPFNSKLMLDFNSVFLVRNDRALVKMYGGDLKNLEELDSIAFFDAGRSVNVKGPLYENVIDNDIEPDYSDLELQEYLSPELVFTDKLSNKCFWNKCTFCNINKFKTNRCEFNLEKYFVQVKGYIEKYNCRHLFLLDEAATPKLVEDFANGLIRHKLDIVWSIRTRIDEGFDEKLISLMYKSGCREMWVGFEAASPRILRYMNKTDSPDQYLAIAHKEMELCNKYGIGLHFCLILGFPNELDSDRKLLKTFFSDNVGFISRVPFFVTFNMFNLNTETDIYLNYNQFGIKEIKYNIGDFNMINIPFIREDTGKEQAAFENELEPFCDELTNIFVKSDANKLLWFTISDSCWELLFKKYNNDKNPFQINPNFTTRIGIKIYGFVSKRAVLLKIWNKVINRGVVSQKSTLYH